MKKVTYAFCFVVALLVMTGCSTYMERDGRTWNTSEPWIYPASFNDVCLALGGGGMYQTGDRLSKVYGWCVVAPLFLIDLPFSLVVDTLFLPKDLHYLRSERKKEFHLSILNPSYPDLRIRLVRFTDRPSVIIRDEMVKIEYEAKNLDSFPCHMCVSNDIQLWSYDSKAGVATFKRCQKGGWGIQFNAVPLPHNPQTNRIEAVVQATREVAINKASQLWSGMRSGEAQKILAGITSSGLGGAGQHYTVDYPLIDGSTMRISYQYKAPVMLPRTNDTAWAEDLLIEAAIWSNGVKNATLGLGAQKGKEKLEP